VVREKEKELIIELPWKEMTQELKEIRERLTPKDRLNLREYVFSANEDIPLVPITPASPPCIFRVSAAFSTSGIFSVVVRDGAGLLTHVLNLFEGASLAPECLYSCDIPVHAGDRITLRYSVGGTARILRIQEVR